MQWYFLIRPIDDADMPRRSWMDCARHSSLQKCLPGFAKNICAQFLQILVSNFRGVDIPAGRDGWIMIHAPFSGSRASLAGIALSQDTHAREYLFCDFP